MKKNNRFWYRQVPTLIVILLLAACKQDSKNDIPWVYLFDGKTLDGWTSMGGNAEYEVVNGAIVGKTKHNTPNTFLTSEKLYNDFILELEFLVDSSINSGIQIRSNSIPQYHSGRVHGYQVEIDPSKRAWSGGIYDEARRGWLNPLTQNEAARKAFKQNQWNHYRIEAVRDTLKTWINGVPAAFLIDDTTAKGFIGLQVHSIDEREKAGKQVLWRNIKILTENLERYSKTMPIEPILTENRLTENEKKHGWRLLWDGKTTEGWRGAKLNHFPEQGWIIEDGELTVLSTGGAESTAGGDIVTEELYDNFELKLEFKITEGANSGIKYYVDTGLNKGEGSSIGLEFQILDDLRHPDAKKGNHKGSRTIGSLYDLIQADTAKYVKPIGEWNAAYIVSVDNHVEHWLNGMKVLEYQRKSENYRKLVSESKYVIWQDFGEAERGNILLQDHGDKVSFRNIKIKQH